MSAWVILAAVGFVTLTAGAATVIVGQVRTDRANRAWFDARLADEMRAALAARHRADVIWGWGAVLLAFGALCLLASLGAIVVNAT